GSPDGGTGKATRCRSGVECMVQDQAERSGYFSGVDDQNDQPTADVENRHQRNQLAGDVTNALDAANQHQGHQHTDHQTGDHRIDVEGALHGVGNRVGLDGVADPKAGKHAEDGEQYAEPFPILAQAVADVV